MARSLTRTHTLVFPLVILMVVLLEEVMEYEMRRRIASAEGRAVAMMALNAVVFSLAAHRVSPWLKSFILRLRSASRSQAGSWGVWAFFVFAYALLYFAYLRLESAGAGGLIPGFLD